MPGLISEGWPTFEDLSDLGECIGLVSIQNRSRRHRDRLLCGPETAPVDHFTVLVESAEMVADIAKADANRHLHPGLSAWDIRDERFRSLFHGNSLSQQMCVLKELNNEM